MAVSVGRAEEGCTDWAVRDGKFWANASELSFDHEEREVDKDAPAADEDGKDENDDFRCLPAARRRLMISNETN
jgi:hypothetical protein